MRKGHKGFTLVELLVVIAIIALLISILAPSLKAAKELAKNAICKTHLHGIGSAVALYANANRDAVPPRRNTSNPPKDVIRWSSPGKFDAGLQDER